MQDISRPRLDKTHNMTMMMPGALPPNYNFLANMGGGGFSQGEELGHTLNNEAFGDAFAGGGVGGGDGGGLRGLGTYEMGAQGSSQSSHNRFLSKELFQEQFLSKEPYVISKEPYMLSKSPIF